jgi:hypothetical protein
MDFMVTGSFEFFSGKFQSTVPSHRRAVKFRRDACMKPISRRKFLRTGCNALIVGFSLHREISPLITWSQTAGLPAQSAKPVTPEELDSWLSIGRDGKVTVYTGRIDMGTGVETAFGQLIADELDMPFESIKIVMGDTELTPDQGKSTASSNISLGALIRRKTKHDVARVFWRCPSRRTNGNKYVILGAAPPRTLYEIAIGATPAAAVL